MKKSDLKSGMVVRFREGDMYFVSEVYGELICIGEDYWNPLRNHNEDLTHTLYKSLDIVEVFDGRQTCFRELISSTNKKPIWRRTEPTEVTMKEVTEVTMKEVCEKFGYQVKIVEG